MLRQSLNDIRLICFDCSPEALSSPLNTQLFIEEKTIAMSRPLFDEDEVESDTRIQINKSFATAYTSRKQKEELRNSRYDDNDDDDSSSDESEDEDAELLTTSLDVNILKTIQALRRKDESIYDPTKEFFPSEITEANGETSAGKHVKKRFKDVIREQILEQMDQEENGTAEKVMDHDKHPLEYDKEQSELKNAFLESTKEDEDEDNWMVVKSQSAPLDENEEALQKEYEALEKTKPSIGISDPRGEIQDGEQFLLDFLKNKKWKEQDDNIDDTPTRKPVTVDSDDESLEHLEKADDFESTYNFRFEQAEAIATSGADYSVVPYARGGSMTTLRRKDETRKVKRETRKEKKAAERKAKEEQLKRLKNAKREEMEDRLREIKKVMGSDGNLDEDAMLKLMEGDFDPEKFEQVMQEQYGDDFYQDKDPEWKSDVDVRQALLQDEDGNVLVGQDELEGGLYDESNEYDDNADFDGENDDAYIEEDEHPVQETTIEKKLKAKMEEELYKLDYEDIVAGMPTRFKYRKVEPNDFGLTTEEILFARDSTLKSFVSLKKLAPYNEDGEHFVGSKKRRKFREMLKHDLEEAMAEEGYKEKEIDEDNEEIVAEPFVGKKQRRQKKGKKKNKKGGDDEKSDTSEQLPELAIAAPEDDIAIIPKEKGKKIVSRDTAVDERNLVQSAEGGVNDQKLEVNQKSSPLDEKKTAKKKEKKRKQKEANGGEKSRSKKKIKFAVNGISESRLGAFGL